MHKPLAALALIIASVLSWSQPGEAIPSQDEAGAALRQNKQANFEKKAEQELFMDSPGETVKPAPAPEAELPGANTEKFYLKKVQVTGNTKVSSDEIATLTAPYENREVTLGEICELATRITEFYYSKGYVSCRAYLPPQTISDDTVEIRILEGSIDRVEVRGAGERAQKRIERALDPLEDDVLNYQELLRKLRQLNLHPDREVKATIIPGQKFGTSDLLVDVKETLPLHASAEVNNFGTENTGRERYLISLSHSNLLGIDDRWALRAQTGKDALAFSASNSIPITDDELRLGLSASYNEVEVGGEFRPLGIEGDALSLGADLSKAFYESDALELTWILGFESKSIENRVLNTVSSEDEIRSLHAAIEANSNDAWGRTFWVNDVYWGLPITGATDKHDPRSSREGAGSPFVRYHSSVIRIHPVVNDTYLYLKGFLQLSPDKLVASEQLELGGVYSVRGYPQSEYLADRGGGGSIELRVPMSFWKSLTAVFFVDAGHAKNISPAVGIDAGKTYVGAGGGFHINIADHWKGRFEWAAPMADRPDDGSNSHFYFSASASF